MENQKTDVFPISKKILFVKNRFDKNASKRNEKIRLKKQIC